MKSGKTPIMQDLDTRPCTQETLVSILTALGAANDVKGDWPSDLLFCDSIIEATMSLRYDAGIGGIQLRDFVYSGWLAGYIHAKQLDLKPVDSSKLARQTRSRARHQKKLTDNTPPVQETPPLEEKDAPE